MQYGASSLAPPDVWVVSAADQRAILESVVQREM